MAPAVGKIFTKAKPDEVRSYIKRPEQIEVAKPLEEIKDIIDTDVGVLAGKRDELSFKLKESELNLQGLLADKKAVLAADTTDATEAYKISAALVGEKTKLNQMTKLADEKLEKSGVSFSRDDLLEAINQIGASRGTNIVGEAEESALKKLATTAEKIESLPENIDAVSLRTILQQIRRDIDFDLTYVVSNFEHVKPTK